MVKRRIIPDRPFAHFITFSCFKRRQFLQADRCKRIVTAILDEEVRRREGCCIGFVIMPNHVHALVWFSDPQATSLFMNKWKDRSSHRIQSFYEANLPNYWSQVREDRQLWQTRYHDYMIDSTQKIEEKLDYMHANPVRSGLVPHPDDWPYSSARHYSLAKSVGVTISAPEGAFD